MTTMTYGLNVPRGKLLHTYQTGLLNGSRTSERTPFSHGGAEQARTANKN